jgi:hypothetical protein
MYLYDRKLTGRRSLDQDKPVVLRPSQRHDYANLAGFAPERQSLQGQGWTLPDVATRQTQVDAIVSPGNPSHCTVSAAPKLPPIGGKLHIDIGGEGRYPEAYNLNPTSKGTVPPWANKDGSVQSCVQKGFKRFEREEWSWYEVDCWRSTFNPVRRAHHDHQGA